MYDKLCDEDLTIAMENAMEEVRVYRSHFLKVKRLLLIERRIKRKEFFSVRDKLREAQARYQVLCNEYQARESYWRDYKDFEQNFRR